MICHECGRDVKNADALRQHREAKHGLARTTAPRKRVPADPADTEPDWSGKCEVCGASPILPLTGLCGPCTFGEAETAGGNW